MIRIGAVRDVPAMLSIYNDAIDDRISSNCDVRQASPDEFRRTYFEDPHGYPVVVKVSSDDRVIGWGAIKKFSALPLAHGVAEVAVYVARGERGAGHGIRLLRELMKIAPNSGISGLVAIILGRNVSSIRGAQSGGFQEVVRMSGIANVDGHVEDIVWLYKQVNAE